MQYREFGNTGLKTSLLGFGGFHLIEIPANEAEKLLNDYLDAGGNYIETAASYANGESERKIGKVIAKRREECILATKTHLRDKEGCINSLNQSLHHLNTDHVDLLIMHAVGKMEELDAILGPGGAIEGAIQLKNEGKINHIGISMHGQPDVLIEAIKRYPFDAVMSTINYYDKFNFPKIENELIPLANEKGVAIILMKPLADGLLYKSANQAFNYAMSQPVSVVVTGMNTQEMLQQDLAIANSFIPMTEEEKTRLYKDAVELGDYVCRQCNLCEPCPENIPISEIFKYEGYFDRQMRDGKVRDTAEFALRDRLRFWFGNKERAMEEYQKIEIKADACTECGECMPKCPYNIHIIDKLKIADYKLANKEIY